MDLSTIDPNIGASMVNLASALSSLVLKGTATAIHGKIESIKNEKDINIVRNTYNEIVNQLLEEREDAVRIAQTYKQELEKVVISDEDIDYLHQTIKKALTVLVALQLVNTPNRTDDGQVDEQGESSANNQMVEMITSLVSKDVLKTMQLLGFNFKAAIGEPLTELCAEKISSLKESQGNAKKSSNQNKTNRR